jgi:hypothetical protein
MAAKAKTNPKPAAPAGKPVKKKAKPLNPIILGGTTGEAFGTGQLGRMIGTLPSKRLVEMLRSRQLPIPKNKEDMVDRLVTWAVRENATFILSLH